MEEMIELATTLLEKGMKGYRNQNNGKNRDSGFAFLSIHQKSLTKHRILCNNT